jgi:hypothetical protein
VHLIKATASHCGSYGSGIGWGVIAADQAVAAALNVDIDPPTSMIARAKRARHRVVVLKIQQDDPRSSGGCVNPPASGVKEVLVFASANGRPYHQIGKTSSDKLRFYTKRHRRYRFYSVAVDKAGNREAPPATPDARLKHH